MIGPRRVDKPLVLYGGGKLGRLAEEIFKELDIPVLAKVDRYNWGDFWVKPKFIPPEIRKHCLLAICVASHSFEEITRPLKKIGWADIVPVWDIIEAYPEVGLHNGWVEQPKDRDDHETYKVMGNLADILSQQHYGAFMNWHISHYEHRDLIIGVSAASLPSTLADIRKRQVIFNFDFMPKHVVIHQEGHELQTIIKNMDRLKAFRPSLEVACYHSRDGLWKIQKTLMDNLPNYQWTFRLHSYQGQSAYIYGTPMEAL